ncbi:hypothetical protein AVEN_253936-1 [Araneus ventricosus]|uniref:Uncharacterized protein n=1 Tax=Araneus ventricosus TaxID=182803 RepID=A0A4Y2CES1_ARAVE|nr:hypothetical protein AVEN_253936-1 [Araneus ventricosus]
MQYFYRFDTNREVFDEEPRNVADLNVSNDVSFLNHADQVSNLKSNFIETVRISRNNFLNEKDWKRKTAKINRMKGKAYMKFRRADPKTTKRIVQDVLREDRKMSPACSFRKCQESKKEYVILYLNRKGKVFLMTFGSQ